MPLLQILHTWHSYDTDDERTNGQRSSGTEASQHLVRFKNLGYICSLWLLAPVVCYQQLQQIKVRYSRKTVATHMHFDDGKMNIIYPSVTDTLYSRLYVCRRKLQQSQTLPAAA